MPLAKEAQAGFEALEKRLSDAIQEANRFISENNYSAALEELNKAKIAYEAEFPPVELKRTTSKTISRAPSVAQTVNTIKDRVVALNTQLIEKISQTEKAIATEKACIDAEKRATDAAQRAAETERAKVAIEQSTTNILRAKDESDRARIAAEQKAATADQARISAEQRVLEALKKQREAETLLKQATESAAAPSKDEASAPSAPVISED